MKAKIFKQHYISYGNKITKYKEALKELDLFGLINSDRKMYLKNKKLCKKKIETYSYLQKELMVDFGKSITDENTERRNNFLNF